jgi:hypothetical protein
MNLRSLFPVLLTPLLVLSQGCTNPCFFPKVRAPFASLDETTVPSKAKPALEEAKADFILARQGKPPAFARYVSTAPFSQSKNYQGKGYTLTLVNDDRRHRRGPAIVLDSSITGGEPHVHDEVDTLWD